MKTRNQKFSAITLTALVALSLASPQRAHAVDANACAQQIQGQLPPVPRIGKINGLPSEFT